MDNLQQIKLNLELTASRPEETPQSKGAIADFAGNAFDSLKYSAIQAPLNGVAQLADWQINKLARSSVEREGILLPAVQIFDAPKPAKAGTAAWYGQVAGGTVGSVLPFVAMYRLMGPGAGAKLELDAGAWATRRALPVIAKSGLAGGIYSGIFQMSDPNEDFVAGRIKNTTVGFLTGATLTASTVGLKSAAIRGLSNDFAVGTLSGAPAGVVSAQVASLMNGKGFADASTTLEHAGMFMIGGAMMGAANIVHEAVKPTSGMKGIKTFDDMKRLADSTRAPGWETFRERSQSVVQEVATTGKIYQGTMSLLAKQPLTLERRDSIARNAQDLAYTLKVLEEQKPIVTIYGSARTPETEFAFQRARYGAGALAKHGWTIMTGGGEFGIMRAGNQGAFEAGGRSIGINIDLKHEQRPNPFQTTSIGHQNFSSRKDALREGQAFILEKPGWGTLDEGLELLTHLQTSKMPEAPVYMVGKIPYAKLDQLFSTLLKEKTISPQDLHRYKVTDDMSLVVRDLNAYKDAKFGTPDPSGIQTKGITSVHDLLTKGGSFAPANKKWLSN